MQGPVQEAFYPQKGHVYMTLRPDSKGQAPKAQGSPNARPGSLNEQI